MDYPTLIPRFYITVLHVVKITLKCTVPHLSKGINNLKQILTKEMSPFLAYIYMPLHIVLCVLFLLLPDEKVTKIIHQVYFLNGQNSSTACF